MELLHTGFFTNQLAANEENIINLPSFWPLLSIKMTSDEKSEHLKSLGSVCLICYKSFSSPVNANINKRVGTSLKLLFRHLRVNTGFGLDSIDTCVDCSILLESYGEIYHEWKLLELQLHWRVSEVSNVIRNAGRIPKRVQAFKAWCNYQDNNNQFKMGLGSDLKELRSRLKLECMNRTKCFPRLELSRVDQEITVKAGSEQQKALFLGWLTSCIAVAALSDFGNGTTDNMQQPEDIPVDEILEITPSMNVKEIPVYEVLDITPSMNVVETGQVVQTDINSRINRSDNRDDVEPSGDLGIGSIKNSFLKSLSLTPAVTTSTVSATSTRGSQRCKCGTCGQWLFDKWALSRHLELNGCLHTKRATLKKLDALLDFICEICCKEYKGNTKNPPRYSLERHLATAHRFHHKNAREYQHLNLNQAPHLCFCVFCGSNEPTMKAMVKHLRNNHRDLLGVPKKFTGSTDTPMGLKKPLKSSEVPTVFSTNTTSAVDNLPDCLATDEVHPLNFSRSYNVQREALMKLDATLDFICHICNKEFYGGYANRRELERHIATVHRFHHENARECNLSEAQEAYFCLFCGSKETSIYDLVTHLRCEHLDVVGVPKKTPNLES